MKSKKSVPVRELAPSTKQGTSPLNLSPGQAKREAGKLHDLNVDLENRKTVDDTSARATPFGRNE